MDKQKEMAIKPEIRERVDGHDISTETVVNGCADGVIPAEEMDPPKRPKNGSVRETLKWMSGKNPDVLKMIDEFKLEVL